MQKISKINVGLDVYKDSISVWVPVLDAKGNSVLGAFALERIAERTKWNHPL